MLATRILPFIFVNALSSSVWAVDLSVLVEDKKGRPLEGMVVSLHGSQLPPPAPEKVPLRQHDKRFDPLITLLPQGSELAFSNQDSITHHVYSFSKPWRGQFRLSQDEMRDEVFNKPGEVVLGCNIHDWMLAYVYVMDTPYYGTTDAKGSVSFRDITPQELNVRVRHPRIRDGRGVVNVDVLLDQQPQQNVVVALKKRLLPEMSQEPSDDDGYD